MANSKNSKKNGELVSFYASLSPSGRLKQSECIRIIFLNLHKPYAKPCYKGFDTLEEYFKFKDDLKVLKKIKEQK